MAIKMLVFFAIASFMAWPLLFAGLGTRREVRARWEEEYTPASGRIVDYVRHDVRTGRKGGVTSWRPIVEFVVEGQAFRLEYDGRMDREAFPVGAAVVVLYNVSDPARFHLKEDPVFITPGKGAIRVALIWIAASAMLTVILAVFVGGLSVDLRHWWVRLQMSLRRR